MPDPAAPTPPAAPALRLRLTDLSARQVTPFVLEPDARTRARLAVELGATAIRKLRLEGTLTPQGRRDWLLRAALGATVVQPCVATLAPVTTRIDEPVERLYSADWRPPAEDEAEIPSDDRLEPLPETLDLGALLAEALGLAMPLYPRTPGADLGAAVFTQPGAAPMTDDDARPFAGLKALKPPPED